VVSRPAAGSTAGSGTLSLRIISDTVSFEWITEQLGLVADLGGNAGEPGPGTYTRTSWLWVLKSGLSNEHHLDEQIQQLPGRLGSRHAALGAVGSKCRMEIFAGAFADNGQLGETVPWPTLKALGDLNIGLNLDLYPARACGTPTE
jgi:hypothetical protein